MAVTVKQVTAAFELLYERLLDRTYAKSAGFERYSERELAHIVRAFLLGYFRKLDPEATSRLPGSPTAYGRIDFVVGNVAIELAVRSRTATTKSALSARSNITEVKKLLCHKGPAILILFDFARSRLSAEDLGLYRTLPSLGPGRLQKSAFNLAYFHRDGRPAECQLIRMNIRPGASGRPVKLAA